MITFKESTAAANAEKASGILGFLPIDLNATMDGISGIKIYQQFAADTSFLPKNYGLSLRFIITGITHKIESNVWTTTVNTVSEPTSVIKLTNDQSFSGIQAQAGPGGVGGSAAVPSGEVAYPASTANTVRLRLRRDKQVFATGASAPDGTGQTLGRLQVLDNAGKVVKTYTTVEHVWRENRSSISCIPPGRYTFIKSKATNNPDLGDVLRLDGPPYRGGILIHLGQTYKNTEGCILVGRGPQKDNKIVDGVPDNQDTTDATADLINYLYPPGAPNTTFAIEVFGVPNLTYVDYRDKVTYANPSALPQEDSAKKSRQTYVNYVTQLNKVLRQLDVYDNGRPLLTSTTGTTDDVTAGTDRLKALINMKNQTIAGKPAPWQNKLNISVMVPAHREKFKEQFNGMIQAILDRDNNYAFKYPSVSNPEAYGSEAFDLPTDY